MDYLEAFTIGTSGPVSVQHMVSLALADENYYDYSLKAYSLLAPLYYGLMAMLALGIGKAFHLSLRKRLLVTSALSICLIVSLSYFVSRRYYKPYKNYTDRDWVTYALKNGTRHFINFNLVMYYLTKLFSESYWWRVFIVGSSLFSYLLTYLRVLWGDYRGKLNYDYRLFATAEPFIQGFDLLASLYVLQAILGLGLKRSLVVWTVLGSLLQTLLAHTFKTYKYRGVELFYYLLRAMGTGFIKIVPFYFLLASFKDRRE
jgi:hypothetical protein